MIVGKKKKLDYAPIDKERALETSKLVSNEPKFSTKAYIKISYCT